MGFVATFCSGEGGELIGDTNGGVVGDFASTGMAHGDLNGGVRGESGWIGTLALGVRGRSGQVGTLPLGGVLGEPGIAVGWGLFTGGTT